MRHLLHPRVLSLASVAALASALACYPRLSLWQDPRAPIWYLEAVIFLCGIILWSFVFAWHARYTGRPVFVLKPGLKPFFTVTAAGILTAAIFRWWLDPSLRSLTPDEYPADLKHWAATVLFSLGLTQLFLIFAPYAWLMRLFKRPRVAISLTALFGTGVLALKIDSLLTPIPSALLASMLVGRVVIGFLTVLFYLRGGITMVWWWTLLLAARLLPELIGKP
jgi:hypothetical protein